MRNLWAVFILVFLTAAFTTALTTGCSTAPQRVGKRGILNYQKDGSFGPTDQTADEMYAPREGEKVTLPGNWRWPLDSVEVSSNYGDRGRKFHQGIDLRASIGTRVHAASDGVVTYVGSKIRGYGRMIVLKHQDGFYTVYAHHSKNVVKLGRKVQCGDVIAFSGKSGHASGPHLHFEIRQGTQSFDPVYALNKASSKRVTSAVTRAVASEETVTRTQRPQ